MGGSCPHISPGIYSYVQKMQPWILTTFSNLYSPWTPHRFLFSLIQYFMEGMGCVISSTSRGN